MELVTGRAGTPHITSQQHRQMHQGIWGEEAYILNTGNMLEPEVQSSNKILIKDGALMFQGALFSVKVGTTDEITINNGNQGMKRKDLVVVRYTYDQSQNIESAEWKVIQGTPAESNPVAPSGTSGDIQVGDSVVDCPFMIVNLDGINVTGVDIIPEKIQTIPELIGDLSEQKILWSGYYLMTSNHTARLSEPISVMTRGITLIFSKYTGGQPRDYNFQSYYIPKKVIEILPAGPGFQIPIYDGDNIGYKYLYIHDEKILGNDSNETPPNNLYVLRYVIGE